MGCISSNEEFNFVEVRSSMQKSCKTSMPNDDEIDITHFENPNITLGYGGFGVVKLMYKITGIDAWTPYAVKTMKKTWIIRRPSGKSPLFCYPVN
jgi:hypothetical protein